MKTARKKPSLFLFSLFLITSTFINSQMPHIGSKKIGAKKYNYHKSSLNKSIKTFEKLCKYIACTTAGTGTAFIGTIFWLTSIYGAHINLLDRDNFINHQMEIHHTSLEDLENNYIDHRIEAVISTLVISSIGTSALYATWWLLKNARENYSSIVNDITKEKR